MIKRISKFDPQNRDHEGKYIPNEWTSITDIGTKNGPTTSEYLFVETAYWNVFKNIIDAIGCQNIAVNQVEFYDDKFEEFTHEAWYEIYRNSLEEIRKRNLRDNETFDVSCARVLFLGLIREVAWFSMDLGKSSKFYKGHDLYFYFDSPENIDLASRNGIFIEHLR